MLSYWKILNNNLINTSIIVFFFFLDSLLTNNYIITYYNLLYILLLYSIQGNMCKVLDPDLTYIVLKSDLIICLLPIRISHFLSIV